MARRLTFLGALLAVTLAVTAGGTAASQPGPFTSRDGGTSAGGYPLAGGGPSGTTVRFIDRGSFWVAVLVKNSADQPVTILGARTPEPVRSLIGSWQARWAPYKPCSGRIACPFPAPSPAPATAPLVVAPGHYAAIKLSYRLTSCAAARSATTATGRRLLLRYRAGNTVATQELALTGARLHLLRPAGEECVPRPQSHIGLVGSFTTSPEHRPMPGSKGDTCTRTKAGGLSFTSRTFFDRNGVAFRISIVVPHLRGTGAYGSRGASGPATVLAAGGFGLHSWTLFADHHGSVTVATLTPTRIEGRFSAVFSGHRRFFRGYGAWRCTVLPAR
jgi:hypothetical protein